MPTDTRQRVTRATIAIAALFFVNGMTYGSWIARLPEIQDDLAVGDAALGLTLVGAGVGALVTSLVAGRLVDRFGSRVCTVSTSVVLAIVLPAIALSPTAVGLFGTLLVIGALDGMTDVAQNAQAMQVQERREGSIVARMHALWSIGTLSGGLIATRAAAASVSLEAQLLVTSLGLLVLAAVAGRWLLPPDPVHESHLDADGRRGATLTQAMAVLLIGMGAAATLSEIPVMEWASLLMEERFELEASTAGLGFVAFASGMVIGRLTGDRAVDRFGTERTRRAGATVGLIGILVVAVAPAALVAALGFVVAGLGVSVLFPLTIRRASELVGGTSRGMAVFTAGSRVGILLSSPLMGAISDATSRTVALVAISGTATAVSAAVRLPTVTPPP